MKLSIWGASLAGLALAISPVQAQQTRSSLSTYNNANINGNGRGAITGPIVNSMFGQTFDATGFLNDSNPWSGTNTFNGPLVINGTLTFGDPSTVRTSLGAAASGTNADITSMTALTSLTLRPTGINGLFLAGAGGVTANRTINLQLGAYSTDVAPGGFATVTPVFATATINADLGANHPASSFTTMGVNAQVGANAGGTEFHGVSGSIADTADSAQTAADWHPDIIGTAGGVAISHSWYNAGSGIGSHIYALTGGTTVTSTGSVLSALGAEVDLFVQSATGAQDRWGYNALSAGPDYTGVVHDAAFNAACSTQGSNRGCWKNALYVAGGMFIDPGTSINGGTVIGGDTNLQLKSVIDLPNATTTGSIINTKSFQVGATGAILGATLRLNTAMVSGNLNANQMGIGYTTTTDATLCGSLTGALGCWTIYAGSSLTGPGGTVKAYYVPMFGAP